MRVVASGSRNPVLRLFPHILLMATVGCATDLRDTGILWYAEQQNRRVHKLDLEVDNDVIVDAAGGFSGLRASLDSRQLAYGKDGRIFVAGEMGEVVELIPGAGELQMIDVTWHRGGWLTYSTQMQGLYDTAIAQPPSEPRLLGSSGHAVVSPDGAQVAYLRHADRTRPPVVGELVVETIDGSDQRVLSQGMGTPAFSPDSMSVLATDPGGRLHQFVLEDGSRKDLGFGGVDYATFRLDPRAYSYDGDHLLVAEPNAISTLSLQTGERMLRVERTDPWQLGPAMYIDEQSILYVAYQTSSTGDSLMATRRVILQRGAVAEELLSSDDVYSPCGVVGAKYPDYVGILCGGVLHVLDNQDGSIVSSVPCDGLLGFESQGDGVVVMDGGGSYVRYVGGSGESATIATIAVGGSSAAYTP